MRNRLKRTKHRLRYQLKDCYKNLYIFYSSVTCVTKVPPVIYSVDTTPAIDSWFQAISFTNLKAISIHGKRKNQQDDSSLDLDDESSSPDQKISKKD